VVWGAADRVIPASYAERLAAGLGRPAMVRLIEGAGHVVELDAPEELASPIELFSGGARRATHA
jgi:pimeloyl-ACP methyl ester carboxylesterase